MRWNELISNCHYGTKAWGHWYWSVNTAVWYFVRNPKAYTSHNMDSLSFLTKSTDSPMLAFVPHKKLFRNGLFGTAWRDIRRWCKECPDCQASKIHRHTRAPLTERPLQTDRFSNLHMDLVDLFLRARAWVTSSPSLTGSQGGLRLYHFLMPRPLPALQLFFITGSPDLECLWTLPQTVAVSLPPPFGHNLTGCWVSTPNWLLPTIHKQMGWLNVYTDNLKHDSKLGPLGLIGLQSFPWSCWAFIHPGGSILAVHLLNLFMVQRFVYQATPWRTHNGAWLAISERTPTHNAISSTTPGEIPWQSSYLCSLQLGLSRLR